MLRIKIKGRELYDEINNEFITISDCELHLEHSLASISKWESKWRKPFMSTNINGKELIDYIRCMTLNENVDDNIYLLLSSEDINNIIKYIDTEQTATWFSNIEKKNNNREIITSEVIYYWMISLSIPPEYEKWHLSRLLTLIRVINEKNKPSKSMNKKTIVNRNRELNELRKKKYRTNG